MSSFNAKVRIARIAEGPTDSQVSFYADYADGKNSAWAMNTPTLSLEMRIRNEVIEKLGLQAGQNFTLTFDPEASAAPSAPVAE